MSAFEHYSVLNDEQIPIMKCKSMEDDEVGKFIPTLEKKLKVEIIKLTEEDIVFDLVGVDVSIANTLRRILLAEVPTMAIETVWVAKNTSIIQDEVLAHRIGLIPLKADPNAYDFVGTDNVQTNKNTVVFHFDVTCPDAPSTLSPEQKHQFSSNALSGSLKWTKPLDEEEEGEEGALGGAREVVPVHSDIVLATLKPGQRIEFEAHAVKGIGKDHAKFSPVATASYRLLPQILLKQTVSGDRAKELVKMCPMKVFDIEDIGKGPTATVARPRDCTMCRECIRKDDWSDRVELRRVADHFIFSVESVGILPPSVIVREAIRVLQDKAVKYQHYVEYTMQEERASITSEENYDFFFKQYKTIRDKNASVTKTIAAHKERKRKSDMAISSSSSSSSSKRKDTTTDLSHEDDIRNHFTADGSITYIKFLPRQGVPASPNGQQALMRSYNSSCGA